MSREVVHESSGIASYMSNAAGVMDVAIYSDLTVCAWLRLPDGAEQFVIEGTPIQAVPVEFWKAARTIAETEQEP